MSLWPDPTFQEIMTSLHSLDEQVITGINAVVDKVNQLKFSQAVLSGKCESALRYVIMHKNNAQEELKALKESKVDGKIATWGVFQMEEGALTFLYAVESK